MRPKGPASADRTCEQTGGSYPCVEQPLQSRIVSSEDRGNEIELVTRQQPQGIAFLTPWVCAVALRSGACRPIEGTEGARTCFRGLGRPTMWGLSVDRASRTVRDNSACLSSF
eukprot:3101346-Prymnesium_polylepis.3